MLTFRPIVLTILAQSLLAAGAAARTIHCVPPGSTAAGPDSAADGSGERPFVGVAAALAEAEPGDRIVLGGGEYRVDSPIRFPRGGEPERPITIEAHAGQYVALLGSVRLTDWQPHEGPIWKHPAPPRPIKGLYEDGERLVHPRDRGVRENPPVASIRAPGRWTVAGGWVYLWCRDGRSPNDHRIEASQNSILHLNKPWLRAERLHVLFGQPTSLVISGDHCEAIDCEVAHVSNSVDNAYGAYFSSCSNSALRRCTVHDSFYWGDHGSNSHLVSCIDCGDAGPNLVEQCVIFNGGLGVGTKGAARQMVVKECHIFDAYRGIVVSGRRSSGPGAGKTDRGHYLILQNNIHDCPVGVYFPSGGTSGNRVIDNRIAHCVEGIYLREVSGLPKATSIINNVITDCGTGIFLLAGRDGHPTLDRFADAGFQSHHNLYHGNEADWRNPLTWTSDLALTVEQVRGQGHGWEQGTLTADPQLDATGRARAASPTLGSGADVDLPEALAGAASQRNIGLGPPGACATPSPLLEDLVLSIAGTGTQPTLGEPLELKAVLRNTSDHDIPLGESCIVTFHFRYAGVWYFDRQEIWRTRVRLPSTTLAAGESMDLSALAGWRNPKVGGPGAELYLRNDDPFFAQGVRLRASAQFVPREMTTSAALQRLGPLLRSYDVLHVATPTT